ncbi:Protein DYAD, partial [Mucuna pruriens]
LGFPLPQYRRNVCESDEFYLFSLGLCVDFAFSDLLPVPVCFGEIKRLVVRGYWVTVISVKDIDCRDGMRPKSLPIQFSLHSNIRGIWRGFKTFKISLNGLDNFVVQTYRMEPWGVHHRVMYIGQHEEDETPSDTSKGEESNDEEEKIIKPEPVFVPEIKKRKRLSLSQLKEVKDESCGKQSSSKLKKKKHESRDRWSAERYKLAEQNMWEVLKAEGATFENPITRPALRLAARKHIGDTGLLDHLLKHIDGKVAPGGIERFRRWFNTNGIMEYWLESAELDKVRQEAGVQDPYWIPPSTYRAGSAPSQNTDSSGELKQLKIELAQMKKRHTRIL